MEPVTLIQLILHVWWPILLAIMCAAVSVCMQCGGLWRRWNRATPMQSQGTQTISRTTRSISTCTTVTFTNEGKKKGENEGHGEEDSVSLRKIQKRLEALEWRSLRDMASSDTESPHRCHNLPGRRRKPLSSREQDGYRQGRRH